MILEPLAPWSKSIHSPITLDIENAPDGSVIAIDTCWRDTHTAAGNIVHKRHDAWGDWWSWFKGEDWPRRRVWAHNGGGWDWLSFAHWYLNAGLGDEMSGALAAGRLISIKVEGVELVDSFNIFRSSLGKVAEKFAPHLGKLGSGADAADLFKRDRRAFEAYLARDTESLLVALERFHLLIRERVAPIRELGGTIAATAMKCWRTAFQEAPLLTPDAFDLRDFCREGYRGGRVEVFRPGIHKGVRVYDANSMYPSVCLTTRLPFEATGHWTKTFKPTACGLYRVDFSQPRKGPAVLMVDADGAYEGSGVYYAPELLRLLEVGGRFNVKTGYVFERRAPILRDYMRKMYALRQEDKGGALGETAKALMNYLTGKFAQHPVRQTLKILPDSLAVALQGERGKVTPTGLGSDLYVCEEEHKSAVEFTAISGFITSQSRVMLHKALGRNPIYCDTDSVHTDAPFPRSLVGPGLGKWKLEADASEGAYLGRKLYSLRLRDGGEKVRAKGVSVGGALGVDLRFRHMKKIAKGGAGFLAEYQSAPTIRGILRGDKPCRFVTRKRTLRVTAGK